MRSVRRPPGSPHRGKTPVSALLSQAYARPGARVIAIDTDSNPNLGESLGLTLDATESMRQLPRSLIVGASGDVTVEDLLHEALAGSR